MNQSYALERISHLIGMIYDCVLQPRKWQSVVDHIREELNFRYVVLGVYPLPAGTVLLGAAAGIEPSYLAQLASYGDEIVELWGGDARVKQYPLEEPILQSEVVSTAALEMSRYYRDWLLPQGVIDAVAIGLERNSRMVSTLSFGRGEAAGRVTEADVAVLRLMAPHFRRAIAISQLLELQSIAAANAVAILDRLLTGVVLVDELMTLIHANPIAQTLLDRGDPIRVTGGRVEAPAEARTALETAVAQAAGDEMALGRRGGTGIPVRGIGGEPRVIHVLPLRRRQSREGLPLQATAALFITPADGTPRLPADAFAALYDLTPAEVRICELSALGRARDDIAAHLGLAPSTVKTHLQRVFEKTGCHRQSDLVRLASSLQTCVGTT